MGSLGGRTATRVIAGPGRSRKSDPAAPLSEKLVPWPTAGSRYNREGRETARLGSHKDRAIEGGGGVNSGARKATGQMKRTTKLLKSGRLNVARVMTSKAHEQFRSDVDREERADVPFIQWKTRQIRKVYTDDYIADLLQRARANLNAMQGFTPSELGVPYRQ